MQSIIIILEMGKKMNKSNKKQSMVVFILYTVNCHKFRFQRNKLTNSPMSPICHKCHSGLTHLKLYCNKTC